MLRRADGQAKDVPVVLLGGVRKLKALPGAPAKEDELIAAVGHAGEARPHARRRGLASAAAAAAAAAAALAGRS